MIAQLLKGQRIPPGAATGIEEMGIGRQFLQEGLIEAAHIDMQRSLDKVLGVLVVVGLGTAHP